MRFLALTLLLVFSNAAAECVGKKHINGMPVIDNNEFAYIIRAYGNNYKNHTEEKIKQLENEVKLLYEKIADEALTDDTKLLVYENIIKIRNDIIQRRFVHIKKRFSLPVVETVKGPEKNILEITQIDGDAPGIESGESYLLILSKNSPSVISNCRVYNMKNYSNIHIQPSSLRFGG